MSTNKMERAISGENLYKDWLIGQKALLKPYNAGLFGSNSRKSVKDLTGLSGKEFPTDVESYDLLEDCGRGVSATVYRALCKPLNEIVAVGHLVCLGKMHEGYSTY